MNVSRHLTDSERLDWLCLARTRNIGPVTFAQHLQRFGSAAAAIDALPSFANRKKNLTLANRSDIERELETAQKYGAKIIASCEPDYPPLLKALAPPPPVLTSLGKLDLAAKPTIAIVGARNASAAGRKMARDMSAELGNAGYTIVSGLARGIDGEAHAAALRTGTIAVLGGAIDHIYPPQHKDLYAEIAAKGLILSENAFGYRATARDFPRRNRLVTGLSRGVVVVEAAKRSGSLISARTAGEQGREVMAVPGSPLDPRSEGANHLIREGAILVRSADDVIEAVSALVTGQLFAPPPPAFEYESETAQPPQNQVDSVESALSHHPMPIDEIARAASISAARCAAILLELELSGTATTLPGGLACLNVGETSD